jgi:hypothetical protein
MGAVLLALGGAALGQGIGIGIGIDDLRVVGKAAAITPCGTSLVFDQTVACNAVDFVLIGL